MRIKTVTDENIVFDNGNVISFDHEQDCCEYNYADFSILNPCVINYDYDFDESEYVACSMPVHYGEREVIKHENMSESEEGKFRDKIFKIPKGYDVYLSNLYGNNYMEIPEPPEAINHQESWEVIFD